MPDSMVSRCIAPTITCSEQFLRDSVNDREGPYGGSVANRVRLVREVMQAVTRRGRGRGVPASASAR